MILVDQGIFLFYFKLFSTRHLTPLISLLGMAQLVTCCKEEIWKRHSLRKSCECPQFGLSCGPHISLSILIWLIETIINSVAPSLTLTLPLSLSHTHTFTPFSFNTLNLLSFSACSISYPNLLFCSLWPVPDPNVPLQIWRRRSTPVTNALSITIYHTV